LHLSQDSLYCVHINLPGSTNTRRYPKQTEEDTQGDNNMIQSGGQVYVWKQSFTGQSAFNSGN
jgi:hypothetical protein